jgi:type I restriction enzyme S subunit
MFTDLKPHADCISSTIPWLRKHPARWRLIHGMAVLRLVTDKNLNLTENTVLSLSYGRIVIKSQDKLHGLIPATFDTYQVLWPGNIVVRPTDLQNDQNSIRVGIVRDHGIITSAYLGFKVVGGTNPEFVYRYLAALDSMKIFYGMGSGLRQNLGVVDFKYLPILLPPLDEQLAIVKYLGHANARIDRAIAAKRKLIALLEEQKQAITSQAVTRGLDPSVPLKESGVPWLGQIPAHWDVNRLGRFARVFNGSTPSRTELRYWAPPDVPWLSSGKVNDYHIRNASEYISAAALKESSVSLVPAGSVVVGLVGQGKTRGKSAIIELNACINQNLAAVVVGPLLDSTYLLHTLTAGYAELRSLGRGGNQEALNCALLDGFRIPLPPVREQRSIAAYVDEQTVRSDDLSRRARREIELLREFKARLTADVVNGQVDIRAAALRLPELDLAELVSEVGGQDEDDLDADLVESLEEVDA